MKLAFVLLVLGFRLLQAADPKAVAEASTAVALAHEGKYELAIQHYRSALSHDPTLPGLRLNLGLAYFKLNNFPDAAAQFELAAKTDPANFHIRVLLGMSTAVATASRMPQISLNAPPPSSLITPNCVSGWPKA